MSLPTLRVPTKESPSFFNEGILTGGSIGALALGIPTLVISGVFGFFTVPAVAAIGFTIGGLIGGVSGKNHMQQEQLIGHEVPPPTLFNKGIITGLFLGAVVGIGLIAGGAAAAVNINGILGTALMVAGAVSAIGGAFFGASHQKGKMTKEYAEAEQYHAQLRSQTISRAPMREAGLQPVIQQQADIAPTQEIGSSASYKNTVSPDDMATMLAKLAQRPDKSTHAAGIEAQRSQAALTEPSKA